MKKENKLFVSYDEATHICDKNQYGEATIWEKILLTIRMFHCKYTRAYSKRNGKLTKVMKTVSSQPSQSSVDKETLKEKFNKELFSK